jgi:hypothetical protein
MIRFCFGMAAMCTFVFVMMLQLFHSIDNHMVEYQECGGYCEPQDPPVRNK